MRKVKLTKLVILKLDSILVLIVVHDQSIIHVCSAAIVLNDISGDNNNNNKKANIYSDGASTHRSATPHNTASVKSHLQRNAVRIMGGKAKHKKAGKLTQKEILDKMTHKNKDRTEM